MPLRAATVWIIASVMLALVGCYDDIGSSWGGDTGLRDAGADAQPTAQDAAHPETADSGPDAADSGLDASDSGPEIADSGPDGGCPNAAIDDSAKLPQGITPPVLWFWRGINQDNLGWYTDATGLHCANGDTTMWFLTPNGHCSGAPSCDPDHFGTRDSPCTGTDCCWRNWDDPRGPEYRVTNNTGPVSVVNYGAKNSSGQPASGYGFEVTVCAAPGTTAVIDTCPRCDVHSCVESNYPQFVDQCDPVRLPVNPAPPAYPASSAGCYSTKHDVTIQF